MKYQINGVTYGCNCAIFSCYLTTGGCMGWGVAASTIISLLWSFQNRCKTGVLKGNDTTHESYACVGILDLELKKHYLCFVMNKAMIKIGQ